MNDHLDRSFGVANKLYSGIPPFPTFFPVRSFLPVLTPTLTYLDLQLFLLNFHSYLPSFLLRLASLSVNAHLNWCFLSDPFLHLGGHCPLGSSRLIRRWREHESQRIGGESDTNVVNPPQVVYDIPF